LGEAYSTTPAMDVKSVKIKIKMLKNVKNVTKIKKTFVS